MITALSKLVTPLEEPLKSLFETLPALPTKHREGLAKMQPWVAIIMIVLLALVGAVGAFGALSLTAFGYNVAFIWIYLALVAVQIVLFAAAFSPLRRFDKKGWDLMFLSEVLWLASGVAAQIAGLGGIVSSIFYTAIGLYILFQARPYFTGEAVFGAPETTGEAA